MSKRSKANVMSTASIIDHPFWHQETRANPHKLYAQMRENDPYCRIKSPNFNIDYLLLTRYEDCVTLLKDNDPRISKSEAKLPREIRIDIGLDPDAEPVPIYESMLWQDPPDHTRLRSLVHKAFIPRRIQNLQLQIEEITSELLDTMDNSSETDYVDKFSHPLPIIVISAMLGLPKTDRTMFKNWVTDMIFYDGEDAIERQQIAGKAFVEYFSAFIMERKDNPQDDILSGLILASDSDDKLSHKEILSMILLLLVAGYETTTNLLGNGLLALLQNPDQLQLFRDNKDNPAFVATAIEELLRYDSPVDATTNRSVLEDMDYLGVPLKAGNRITALLVAANRDPAQFKNPNTLDLRRDPNKHIAFGSGIHYCLGAPLARLETQIAFPALLSRYNDIQITIPINDIPWTSSVVTRGVAHMPICYKH